MDEWMGREVESTAECLTPLVTRPPTLHPLTFLPHQEHMQRIMPSDGPEHAALQTTLYRAHVYMITHGAVSK